jgi:hypothetical protein
MATISEFYRANEQGDVQITGTTTSAIENWFIKFPESDKMTSIKLGVVLKGLSKDNAYGFTVIGQTHPDDSSLVAVGYSPQSVVDESHSVYKITVNFSNDRGTVNNSTDPLEAQPNISYDLVDNIVVVETEQSGANEGNAIQNSAGKPIVLTEDEPFLRCTIVRNEDDYKAKTAKGHFGRVNTGSVTIVGETFAAGTCMLNRWTGSNQYDNNGNLYWSVTYEIIIRDEGFIRNVVDKGLVDKNGKSAPVSAGFINGEEYKLDGNGSFLSKEEQSDPTSVSILPFNTKKTSNWGKPTRLGASPSDQIILTGQTSGLSGLN